MHVVSRQLVTVGNGAERVVLRWIVATVHVVHVTQATSASNGGAAGLELGWGGTRLYVYISPGDAAIDIVSKAVLDSVLSDLHTRHYQTTPFGLVITRATHRQPTPMSACVQPACRRRTASVFCTDSHSPRQEWKVDAEGCLL